MLLLFFGLKNATSDLRPSPVDQYLVQQTFEQWMKNPRSGLRHMDSYGV